MGKRYSRQVLVRQESSIRLEHWVPPPTGPPPHAGIGRQRRSPCWHNHGHTSFDRSDEPVNQMELESSCLSLCPVQVLDPAVKHDFILNNYFTSFIKFCLNKMLSKYHVCSYCTPLTQDFLLPKQRIKAFWRVQVSFAGRAWMRARERQKMNRETKQTNPTLAISVVPKPPW